MRPSATQRAYDDIKGDVLSGALQPGERIFIEDLCARLGVSRTPVREALLALEREGLVRIVPRHGYFASEISYRKALDAYQLRFFLEPMATAMAAQRVTPDELVELRMLADVPGEGAADSFARAVEQNRAFHVRIAGISGNQRLARIMADLLDDMKRLTYVELRARSTRLNWQEEHDQIMAALERRDPALAARAVRATFQNWGPVAPQALAELDHLLDEVNQLAAADGFGEASVRQHGR